MYRGKVLTGDELSDEIVSTKLEKNIMNCAESSQASLSDKSVPMFEMNVNVSMPADQLSTIGNENASMTGLDESCLAAADKSCS
jgi:hypothetical protein